MNGHRTGALFHPLIRRIATMKLSRSRSFLGLIAKGGTTYITVDGFNIHSLERSQEWAHLVPTAEFPPCCKQGRYLLGGIEFRFPVTERNVPAMIDQAAEHRTVAPTTLQI